MAKQTGMKPGPTGSGKAAPGAYRRAIRIAAYRGQVKAEMEDDVHHFVVALRQEHRIIVNISGKALRTPWTICPGALHRLEDLRGSNLDDLKTLPAAMRVEQCLHLYDLALLAANHAANRSFNRLYQIEANFNQSPPPLTLWCDGHEMLSWTVASGRIIGSPYDGFGLKDLHRALETRTADEAEAALILRRASLIAPVRSIDLDAFESAMALNPRAPAICFARQPTRSGDAVRNRGSSRDFHGEGRWPLT